MKVLSVKQPWSFLICSGIKDIENRTWKLPEKYKGERVLIHASAKLKSDLGSLLTYEQRLYIADHSSEEIKRMRTDDFNFSAIIGSVRFVDCRISHQSIWAEQTDLYGLFDNTQIWDKNGFESYDGRGIKGVIYNWVVADPILFDKPILNVKGKLGFWNYDLPEEYETILKL